VCNRFIVLEVSFELKRSERLILKGLKKNYLLHCTKFELVILVVMFLNLLVFYRKLS
jgi:hypothetical protein